MSLLSLNKFSGTDKLVQPAKTFLSKGAYTQAPKNSIAYKEYWDEQRYYCKNGFTIDGLSITGRHYFYINFFPIFMKEKNKISKTLSLPYFYDYDYYYFHMIEQARQQNKGIILSKSRRKGFSYKSASVLAHEYTFVKNSINLIGAYLEEYSQQTMSFAKEGLNFLQLSTPFGKLRIKNTEKHIRSGYKMSNGTIGGMNSEIKALTFQNNTSKAIGKSANIFLFEEVGKWNNLLKTYNITLPLLMAGNNMIGLPILQGTGGEMGEGTKDFIEMFYNPDKYQLLAVDNEWDEDRKGTKCGLFFPASYGHEGLYGINSYNKVDEYMAKPMIDLDGNSNHVIAETDILERREHIGTGKDQTAKYLSITEFPLKPSESFMITSGSVFNLSLLNSQLTKVRMHKQYLPERGKLEWVIEHGKSSNSKVEWIPNPEGDILIWEHPIKGSNAGCYVSGIDPIDIKIEDKKAYHSDGAMLVLKRVNIPMDLSCRIDEWHTYEQKDRKMHNGIVCEYVDRPNNPDDFYDNTLKINTYFNCTGRNCMVENNKSRIIDYYNRLNKTHIYLHGACAMLQASTSITYNPSMKIGITVDEHVKIELIQWTKSFLERYTHHIFSQDLLDELLRYNPKKGNFDRVSALLMLIAMFEEESYIASKKVKKEFVDLPMYQMINGVLTRV